MARRTNELFIGREHLSVDGPSIKHPSLISVYANVNSNKVKETPITLIGMDLETNHKTAELKLLGFWDGKDYEYHTSRFLDVFFAYCKYANKNHHSFAYWNRLDPFVLFKQFLLETEPEDIKKAMERFGKIGGEWSKEDGRWLVQPVVEVNFNEEYYFGIKNVVRSSIQFFYRKKGGRYLDTVWAYDIAQLYENGLEKEAMSRLPYYSKVDKTAHLVDWEKFETDSEYRELVLKSNKLDSMAVYDLGNIIQKEFQVAFGVYPNTIVSTGSLARSAVVASLWKKFGLSFEAIKKMPDNEVKAKLKLVDEEIKSIGFINHFDRLVGQYGQETMKDLYALTFEAYSGGYIETIRYGYAKEGCIADITSAYPSTIVKLLDLRNCTIEDGIGEPPHRENAYVFIRGFVNIPIDVNYHPITVKHPIHESTNIRAVGEYYASYTIEERDYLLSRGATFSQEKWFVIQTEGKLSPLAESCQSFYDLRMKLRAENNSAQYMAKIAMNSLYGILFEAVDTYEDVEVEEETFEDTTDGFYHQALKNYRKKINLYEIRKHLSKSIISRWHSKDGDYYPDTLKQELETYGVYLESDNPIDIMQEVDRLWMLDLDKKTSQKATKVVTQRMGYRGGEFLNAIYASMITSQTRILLAKASQSIEDNGGKPILLMTDSIIWEGKPEQMPSNLWKEKKTLGYFEKPSHITDIVCLGAGRYEYHTDEGKQTAKKRGLNAVDLHDPDGIIVNDFNWINALKIMQRQKTDKMQILVRALISVGMVLNNHSFTYKELGLVVEQIREVDAVVGKNKRNYDDSIKNAESLATGLVDTEPLVLSFGFNGNPEYSNQTLPELRRLMMVKQYISPQEKRKANVKKASSVYYDKKKEEIKQRSKDRYEQVRSYGYTVAEANKMCKWSLDRIHETLRRDGKI